MIVYRLAKEKFANDLSGKGAEITGGRWNHKGTPVVYTSESRALCTAEIAVHIPMGIIPVNYFLITIEIPEDINIVPIKHSQLPKQWNEFPYPSSTQDLGEKYLQNNLVLKVPSAVVNGDSNFLLNPNHPDISKINIKSKEAFSFDKRLFS